MVRGPPLLAREPVADADSPHSEVVCRANGLVVRLRKRFPDALPNSDRHGHWTGTGLCALRRSGVRKSAVSQLRAAVRLVPARASLLRRVGNGRTAAGAHDAGVSAWGLQISARAHLGDRGLSVPVYHGNVLLWSDTSLGP